MKKADSEQKKNGLPIPKGRLVMGPYKPICRGRDCANLLDQITVGTQSCSWNKLCCSGEHACKNQAHDWVICNSCTSKNPFKHIIILPWKHMGFHNEYPINYSEWSILNCFAPQVLEPSVFAALASAFNWKFLFHRLYQNTSSVGRLPFVCNDIKTTSDWKQWGKFWVEVGSVLMFFLLRKYGEYWGKMCSWLEVFFTGSYRKDVDDYTIYIPTHTNYRYATKSFVSLECTTETGCPPQGICVPYVTFQDSNAIHGSQCFLRARISGWMT